MPYKDPEKQRKAVREANTRFRERQKILKEEIHEPMHLSETAPLAYDFSLDNTPTIEVPKTTDLPNQPQKFTLTDDEIIRDSMVKVINYLNEENATSPFSDISETTPEAKILAQKGLIDELKAFITDLINIQTKPFPQKMEYFLQTLIGLNRQILANIEKRVAEGKTQNVEPAKIENYKRIIEERIKMFSETLALLQHGDEKCL